LNFETTSGAPAAVTLPTECIQQLLMTLPQVASMAIQAKHGDPTLRLVFPLDHWRLEEAAGEAGDLILTLITEDRFAVAFAIKPEDMRGMARAAASARYVQTRSHLGRGPRLDG
jgi:hypothetical protein